MVKVNELSALSKLRQGLINVQRNALALQKDLNNEWLEIEKKVY